MLARSDLSLGTAPLASGASRVGELRWKPHLEGAHEAHLRMRSDDVDTPRRLSLIAHASEDPLPGVDISRAPSAKLTPGVVDDLGPRPVGSGRREPWRVRNDGPTPVVLAARIVAHTLGASSFRGAAALGGEPRHPPRRRFRRVALRCPLPEARVVRLRIRALPGTLRVPMVRYAVPSLCALVVALAVAPPARAERTYQVWEPAGPVSTSAGMTAVATDPDDPKVVWIGSATTVWVSEDEGATFHLVLQLSRASGLTRDTGSEPVDEPTELEDDPDEQQRLEEEIEDDGIDQDELLVLDTDDPQPVDEDGGTEDGASEQDARMAARFGVVRMRLFGELLYVCTSRGLYRVDRAARRMGTGLEVRFGRKVAVNDVAVSADKRLWIATDGGLVLLGPDGIGRAARGLEEDLQVRALAISEGRLIAATSRGLRIASLSFDGFDRLSVGGREDAGLEDILSEPDARILVAGANQVSRIHVRPGDVPVTEESWSVPGATRLALSRDGARWATGAKGAWRWKPDQAFERVTDGLFDRRLRDVAPGYGPTASLWAVGRSGAWRLVADAGRAYTASGERLAKSALEGFPSDAQVLTWAVAMNGSNLDVIDGWALSERLAWLLPHIELRWRWTRQRQEDFLQIPLLDRRVLDSVDVRPIDDEFRIMAYWDVMPAITAALESGRGAYESARVRARRALGRVREVVLPLYQTWARKRIDLAAAEEIGLRDALKAMLAIQRLESDLHVYTGGRFPVEAPTAKKPPKPLN